MNSAPPSIAEVATSSTRRIGIVVASGGLVGLVVGGIGGRLFMFVLARLNPEASGVRSDDGFEIGQLTLTGTLNLFLIGTLLGVVGGVIFYVLRGLRFGPSWFRVLSVPVGATIVVGSILVHSDGVDFRLLEPLWLAVTLTLAVPFVYTLALAALMDHWLDEEPRIWRALPDVLVWTVRGALVVLAVVTLADLVSTINDLTGNPFQFD